MAEPDSTAAESLLPLWTLTLAWELRRGRQVILYGEVNDRFWLSGRFATFRDLLVVYLTRVVGADIVGWWNPVDGLTFPVPGHQARFDEVRGSRAGPASPGAGSAAAGAASQPGGGDAGALSPLSGTSSLPAGDGSQDDAEAAATPATVRQATRRNTFERAMQRQPARLVDVRDVLDAIRHVVSSSGTASAFVLQDIDAVIGTGEPAAMVECLRLRAAMDDAVVPDSRSGDPPHARNVVIAVTGDLSRVPAWLYQEDPRIEPLGISKLGTGERRLVLSMLREQFEGIADEAELWPLIGPTDGLNGWQLDALARTSVIRGIPAQKVTRLLDAYRYNVRTNPWAQLDIEMIRQSHQRLARRVIGQDRAVAAVTDALAAAFVGVDFGASGAARPRGVFFFVGPTGVGKTELAKAVATMLFGDESAYARFDMSEYQQEHAAERLAGAPPGYTGYEQGGELTRRVQERPFSVLLFDEIEKAHPAVLDKFLQILEDGRLTDGRGQTAYFSQCLIIFTSNEGASGLAGLVAADASGTVPYDRIEQHFTAAVEAKFAALQRPEIYGRLRPGVVVFDMLRPWHIAGITDRLIGELIESVRERHRVELAVDSAAVRAWIETLMSAPERLEYGGRQIRNELQVIRSAFVRYFVASQPAPGTAVRLTISPAGEVTIEPGQLAAEAGPGQRELAGQIGPSADDGLGITTSPEPAEAS